MMRIFATVLVLTRLIRRFRTEIDACDQIKRSNITNGVCVWSRVGGVRWTAATVKGYRCSVLHEVNVGNDVWLRHRNHLAQGLTPPRWSNTRLEPLLLKILLDIFDLPAINTRSATGNPVTPMCRRSSCLNQQTRLLQIGLMWCDRE